MDLQEIQDALLGITFAAIAILRIVRVVNSRKIASAFSALNDGEHLLLLIFLSFANAVMAIRSESLVVRIVGSLGCIAFSIYAIRILRRMWSGEKIKPTDSDPP